MQLIIGGMGFIALIQDEIGKRVFVEQLDVNDRSALLEIGASP